MRLAFWASLLVCIFSLSVRGAVYQSTTYTTGFANGGVIPDANPNGWQDTRTISGFDYGAQILDVNVRLQLSGGFNGDLYAYLYHAGTMVVLLNRVGATAANPYGYLTSGMNVTFDGSAAIDIHLYGGGANVIGTYQPDQRNSNPANTIDTSPRGPGLDAFNGLDPNGSWTLFFSDMSGGGETQIQLLGFDITATPEPTTIALAIFGSIAASAHFLRALRRRRTAVR